VWVFDLAGYVTVIETPAGINPRARTKVHLHGQEYDLPSAAYDEASLGHQQRPGQPVATPPG
jgi:hypothetical protein